MPLQLAVFDYDLTLTVHHMVYVLSGGEASLQVPPPHARTERGQLARLLELDRQPGYQAQGGFAQIVFGSADRVKLLRQLLEELRSQGVECVVCSKSLVGPLRRCMDRVGLLGYFSKIYANVGDVYGATDYDQMFLSGHGRLGQDERYLGSAGMAGWGSKRELVARLMTERGLRGADAVFVDDTEAEVRSLEGLCATVHVAAHGIGQRECTVLRQMATELGPPTTPLATLWSVTSVRRPQEVPEEPDLEPVCTSATDLLTDEFARHRSDAGPRRYNDGNVMLEDDVLGMPCACVGVGPANLVQAGPRRYGDGPSRSAQIEDDTVGISCGTGGEERQVSCVVQ